MTLQKLESAIRPQFIWQKVVRRPNESEEHYLQRAATVHKFHIDESRQHYKNLALIIFVGLINEYRIGEGRAVDYLDISEHQYSYFLGKYNKYLKKASDVEARGKKVDIHQPYGRMTVKLGLVRNYLRLY